MADPLEMLLNQTIPNFLAREMSNLREDERQQSQEQKAEKRYLQEFNRNETRYNDKIRSDNEKQNEERDRIIISRGSEMGLNKRNQYYGHLVDSGKMKSTFGYDLLEGESTRARSELERSSVLKQGLGNYNLDDFEYMHIENMYDEGNHEQGFQDLQNILDNKVDLNNYPEIKASVKAISSQISQYSKDLVDPYGILTEVQKKDIRKNISSLTTELSSQYSQISRNKIMNSGGDDGAGRVDSTDWNILQINDKVFDPTSQKFFGKPVQKLSSEEHIRLGAWISKNSPRQIGKTKSGWNNWTVFWKKDEKTGEELYKKHLNKSDAYYMSGGLSKSDLGLINQEFGKDAPIAKAVMMAESGGKYGATNQNFKGGGSKTGSIKRTTALPTSGKPFEQGSGWNNSAVNYMSGALGISKKDLKSKYGDYVEDNFLNKFMNADGSSKLKNVPTKRANEYLKDFTEKLKKFSKQDVLGGGNKLKVPSRDIFGDASGKKLNKSIVADLLSQKSKALNRYRGGKSLTEYNWLDKFANELGFASAEELNSKQGARAMRAYYSEKPQETSNKIDFDLPFQLNLPR